jgi:hypothetical protein
MKKALRLRLRAFENQKRRLLGALSIQRVGKHPHSFRLYRESDGLNRLVN